MSDDTCKHGWLDVGLPGDMCHECIYEDGSRDTVAAIVAWLRTEYVAEIVDVREVMKVADAIEERWRK